MSADEKADFLESEEFYARIHILIHDPKPASFETLRSYLRAEIAKEVKRAMFVLGRTGKFGLMVEAEPDGYGLFSENGVMLRFEYLRDELSDDPGLEENPQWQIVPVKILPLDEVKGDE